MKVLGPPCGARARKGEIRRAGLARPVPSRPASSPSQRLAAAAVFLVVGAALGPLLAPAASAAAVEPPPIQDAQFIENETRTIDAPIVVGLGGVLTVRNAALHFNLTQDGGLRLEVLAGGALLLDNVTLRPADNSSSYYWNFLVAGRLEAHKANIFHLRGDAGLGGLELTGSDILIEDSWIHDNRYFGVMVHSGAPLIRNTTVETNTVGIFATPSSSPRLENVTIRHSSSFGLKMNDATPVVRNLTVQATGGTGVGAAGSTLDIDGCRVEGTATGVEAVLGSTGGISHCQFLGVGTALHADTSPVRMSGCTVLSASVGVNATSASVVVEDNSFVDVSVGVRTAGDQQPGDPGQGISNSFQGTGVGYEIFVPSFYLEGNTYAPAMIGARIFHTLTLVVVNSTGVPAARAHVSISDALGASVFTGVADQDGNVTAELEEYRILSDGTRVNMTPHSVRFETGALVQNATINATSDRAERFQLASSAPPTPLGVSREGLLFIAAAFAFAALAGALSIRIRRRRGTQTEDGARARQARRRGPRRGR